MYETRRSFGLCELVVQFDSVSTSRVAREISPLQRATATPDPPFRVGLQSLRMLVPPLGPWRAITPSPPEDVINHEASARGSQNALLHTQTGSDVLWLVVSGFSPRAPEDPLFASVQSFFAIR